MYFNKLDMFLTAIITNIDFNLFWLLRVSYMYISSPLMSLLEYHFINNIYMHIQTYTHTHTVPINVIGDTQK